MLFSVIKRNIKRIVLLLLMAAALAAAYQFGWIDLLRFEKLKANRDALLALVAANYLAAVAIYILTFTVAIALALPAGAVMCLTGGFLFGIFPGLLYVNLGATSGAVLSFLATRYIIGDWVQDKYAARLRGFNARLKRE